jgi:hypothetical protein
MNPVLEAAQKGLDDFEKLLWDTRDVLFNLADDLRAQVPASLERAETIARINRIRSKIQ